LLKIEPMRLWSFSSRRVVVLAGGGAELLAALLRGVRGDELDEEPERLTLDARLSGRFELSSFASDVVAALASAFICWLSAGESWGTGDASVAGAAFVEGVASTGVAGMDVDLNAKIASIATTTSGRPMNTGVFHAERFGRELSTVGGSACVS
jgi:hypothetical protein